MLRGKFLCGIYNQDLYFKVQEFAWLRTRITVSLIVPVCHEFRQDTVGMAYLCPVMSGTSVGGFKGQGLESSGGLFSGMANRWCWLSSGTLMGLLPD